ncbi:shikimate kinase [Nocardioides sp. B-3]|nr:shikimate kinase [Nocardioides sp. B-3]UUZ61815.1 shikimate kinase [Nocardioides sp. B-3]
MFVDSGEAHFPRGRGPGRRRGVGHPRRRAVAGWGAVLDPATRALLQGHTVVFLRVGLSEAVKRVGSGVGRPMLLGNVRSRIKALLDERTPIYEAAATLAVDTDGRTPDEVAAEIQEQLA